MELSNVGDRVFAAERILKKRTRRVRLRRLSKHKKKKSRHSFNNCFLASPMVFHCRMGICLLTVHSLPEFSVLRRFTNGRLLLFTGQPRIFGQMERMEC